MLCQGGLHVFYREGKRKGSRVFSFCSVEAIAGWVVEGLGVASEYRVLHVFRFSFCVGIRTLLCAAICVGMIGICCCYLVPKLFVGCFFNSCFEFFRARRVLPVVRAALGVIAPTYLSGVAE